MEKFLFFLKTVFYMSLSYRSIDTIDAVYKRFKNLTVSPDCPKELLIFEGSFKDEFSCNAFCCQINCSLFTRATLKNGKKECAFYNFLPEEEYIVYSHNSTVFINKSK